MNSLDAIKARIAALKDKPPPEERKESLSDILARAKSLGKEAKQCGQWRTPEEETFEIKVPRSINVQSLILQVRADFPRQYTRDKALSSSGRRRSRSSLAAIQNLTN